MNVREHRHESNNISKPREYRSWKGQVGKGTLRAACMMWGTMGITACLPMAVAMRPIASVARHRLFNMEESVACIS